MIRRISARDIDDSLIGAWVVEFSHAGEHPRSAVRRVDSMDSIGGPQQIVYVRRDDSDNHIALLLGRILERLWRDDDGRPGRDETGNWRMVPTDPPEGGAELGFTTDGWVEVADDLADLEEVAQ